MFSVWQEKKLAFELSFDYNVVLIGYPNASWNPQDKCNVWNKIDENLIWIQ